ncbi:MAG: 30S ribosomal protein S6 [Patescibacteria group bacterium]
MTDRDYELTTITKEETVPAIEQAITRAGGTVNAQRSLGRRSFAYPIKKETAGFYTAYQLLLNPTALVQLDKELRLMPDILRHLLVSLPIEKLTTSLEEGEELKEASELGSDTATELPADQTVDDAARTKKLDEQLGKLLSDDASTDDGLAQDK